MSTLRPILIRKPLEVRAVSSPIAHRVISVMERTRRNTVAELALLTGVEAGSLYYHVRRLKKIGVLGECERLSTGGRQEVVYEMMGTEVVIDPDANGPALLAEIGRSVRSRLKRVARDFNEALGRSGTIRRKSGRNLSLHQHQVRLSRSKRAELYRRIEELESFLVENDDAKGREFLNLTLVIHPEVGGAD